MFSKDKMFIFQTITFSISAEGSSYIAASLKSLMLILSEFCFFFQTAAASAPHSITEPRATNNQSHHGVLSSSSSISLGVIPEAPILQSAGSPTTVAPDCPQQLHS
eukprot:TRINITY_DN19928_c0_g1_i2.p1 TRINITY_DN19928_c0_g1~~TRINITY_DN19928_c0_g1_i2.p1  ORF type:complete len:106 (-),score=24.57 TRINITY_DN19928_c0_g1_i2:8-325(-)